MTVPALPSARRVFAVTFVSTMLLQVAWILAMPAFQGIDEFDHVYKAESVAHGQWWPSSQPVEQGRGGLVRARGDVVRAATPVCEDFDYTGRDNCRAVQKLGGGLVTVASGAARYNPVWYAVMGTAALPFHGEAAVYAMRLVTSLTCALLFAWAAALTTRWARDRWPLAATALAITPVMVYSGSVAAPNGVTYAAALLTWSAGLALARSGAGARPLLPLATGASLLAVTHSTGPVWLLVVLGVLFLLAPRSHWRDLARRHRTATVTAATAVAVTCVASLAYVATARTNAPDGPDLFTFSAVRVAFQVLLWPFQAVAAFPIRDQPAPPVVYALWLLPLVALLVTATRHARGRVRAASTLLLLTTIVVPVTATVATYTQLGTAWQGRYSLPLYVGLPLIAGWTLTGVRPLRHHVVVVGTWLLAAAGAVSIAHVARVLVPARPGTSAAELLPAGWLLVAVLAGAGSLVWLAAWRTPAVSGDDAGGEPVEDPAEGRVRGHVRGPSQVATSPSPGAAA